jgi:hypothetical protein
MMTMTEEKKARVAAAAAAERGYIFISCVSLRLGGTLSSCSRKKYFSKKCQIRLKSLATLLTDRYVDDFFREMIILC